LRKNNIGYLWILLGTLGRIWAKLGLVKVEVGQNRGVEGAVDGFTRTALALDD
jgi:hypothetical protein